MATTKQERFFEILKKQGRPSPVDSIEDLGIFSAWKVIAEMLGQEGDGEAYQSDETNNEILEEYKKHQKEYEPKVSRKEKLNEEDTKKGFNMQWLQDQSEDGKYSMLTDKLEEAMWVTPSGRTISGNFQDGFRNLDHRNALTDSSSEGIRKAVNEQGAIRVIPEYQSIQVKGGDIANLPKASQAIAKKYIAMGWDIEEVDV